MKKKQLVKTMARFIHDLGENDFKFGKSIIDNPYPEGSFEFYTWLMGYHDAEDKINKAKGPKFRTHGGEGG